MSGLIVSEGDKFYQCDVCSAVHHVAVDALPFTPSCPPMAPCGGGEPVTEITLEEAEGLL